jgi:hypothetical protein
MPVTAIKIGDVRLKFITTPTDYIQKGEEFKQFLIIDLYQCDNEFIPTGTASRSIHEDDEQEYHIKLRVEALAKRHFIQAQSTDPEWTPGYLPAISEVHGD